MIVQHKKIINVLAGLLLLGSISFAVFNVTNANALECGVLPDSICANAEKKPEGGQVRNSAVWQLLLAIVNIMTAGVAILAVGGIIYGAVLYTSAGPNQGQVAKAREILMNVVIGVVAFALMYSLLQWLIPGGVFNV